MRSRSSFRAARGFTLAALGCIACQFLAGSVALSQPFPSFMLDSSLTRMPGFDNVYRPNVAFGPDIGLVVWTTESSVRGVRVDRNGTLLDSITIDIDGPDFNDPVYMRPGVAWSGQSFLVVWSNWDVTRCALVHPDGRVTARAVLQDSVETPECAAAVAFDGTNFLASWFAAYDTFGLTAFFSRVSPQGVVLDSPPRMVAPLRAGEQYGIALCFHEDRYLAVWNDWDTSGLSGNFIMPDGTIADSGGFTIRHGVSTRGPAVTHDRNNFLVSWNEQPMVKTARVTDGGQVLDSVGVMIDSFSLYETGIVSNGDTTLVLFLHDSLWGWDSLTLVAVRIDAALNRLDAVPVKISAPGDIGWGDAASSPAAAMNGDDYFIVWQQPLNMGEWTEDNDQALCRRMDRNGQPIDPTPVILSYGADRQSHPDVASDGDNFLAAWSDLRRDPIARAVSVRGSRFTPEGALLDPSPIWLGSSEYELRPAVAFGGGCYLAVWYDADSILAKRITPAGVVLDSAPLHIADPGGPNSCTDVAFGDSVFLVVWPVSSPAVIHGCRITPAGVLLDTTPLLLVVDQTQQSQNPRVAFDGVNFLVARDDGEPEPDAHRCVRVSPNGEVMDTADITVGAAGSGYQTAPELAYGSGVYFVVDNSNSRCWRVSPDGSLLDSVPHSYSDYSQVVFDETDFMLLCELEDSSGQLTNSLGGMRITPSGRVLDSTPFTLVTADSAQAGARYAAMTANGANRVGIAFTGYEPAPYLTSRIRATAFPAVIGIGSGQANPAPTVFRALPNPASGRVTLSFGLRQAGPVQVSAFDAAGRRCAGVHSGSLPAGTQSLTFDTRRLANGIYFLRFEAGADTRSARLVVSH